MKSIITITRQLGSGGSYVGQQLAKRLGFNYLDRQVLELAAKELGLAETEVAQREEKICTYWDRLTEIFALGGPDAAYSAPPLRPVLDEAILAMENQVMLAAAKESDCVIVGRGASAVFRDDPRAYKIFLHAPSAFRIQRVMAFYGARTEPEARGLLASTDRSRSAFMDRIAGPHWLEAEEYDLCINTGRVPMDQVVETILRALPSKK